MEKKNHELGKEVKNWLKSSERKGNEWALERKGEMKEKQVKRGKK
jgi:hypothetical protein